MDKVKLGFIGCGHMGQRAHLENYATLPDVELVALADLRPQTREAVATRYGIGETYATHAELLEKAEVDAVVAIMGYALHHAIVPDVLRAGKHCLTEKPICLKASTARAMAALAAEQGVVYQIGYMKRCDLASRRTKQLIADWRESGAYGKLNYLRVAMPPGDWTFQMAAPLNLGDAPEAPGVSPESFPDSMTQDEQQRYNAFINYYIHQVNLIRFLLGEDYTVEYIDAGTVLLVGRSDSGVTLVLEMATHHLRDEWHEFYTACFERGKLSLSLCAPLARQHVGSLRIYRNTEEGGVHEEPAFPATWCMLEQARLFIEAVKGERECIAPPEEAAEDLEVAEAFIEIQRRG